MTNMGKYIMSRFVLNFVVLALIAARFRVECKSVRNQAASAYDSQADPLLAMPSDNSAQMVYEQASQPQYEQHTGDTRYVVQYEQSPRSYQVAQPLADPNQSQEVYYVVDSENNAQPRSRSEQGSAGERPCDQYDQKEIEGQTENNESRGGNYPAEIVYVGQNGDSSAGGQESILAGPTSERANDYAEAVEGHPGLPATILSEVPVKDLPEHVLEKLKRHYGVRVVATRERPGANLVINCDDFNGSSGSICARPSSQNMNVPETYELQTGGGNRQVPSGETYQADQIQGYRFASEADKTNDETEDFGSRPRALNEQVSSTIDRSNEGIREEVVRVIEHQPEYQSQSEANGEERSNPEQL